MKAVITIEFEVDGELPKDAKFRQWLLDELMQQPQGLASEKYDGSDEWLMLVNTVEVRLKP